MTYFLSRGIAAPARVLDIELSGARTIVPDPIAGGVIVPDPDWPNMYRIRLLDGTLSDMVNLSRAKDAARSYGMVEVGAVAGNADREILPNNPVRSMRRDN